MARIVDSILVDEDGADQSTELYQCVPVAAVAGEAGSLDRENGADTTFTDCGQQPLEARTGDASARSSEIVVDDLGRSSSQAAWRDRQARIAGAGSRGCARADPGSIDGHKRKRCVADARL